MISPFALLYVHKYMLFSSWLTKWLMEPNINSILCSLSSLWHLLSRHWYMIYSPVPYCVSSICFFPESISTPFYIFNFSRMLLAMARYFFFHYLIFLKRIHFLFKKKEKREGRGRRKGQEGRRRLQAKYMQPPLNNTSISCTWSCSYFEEHDLFVFHHCWDPSPLYLLHKVTSIPDQILP